MNMDFFLKNLIFLITQCLLFFKSYTIILSLPLSRALSLSLYLCRMLYYLPSALSLSFLIFIILLVSGPSFSDSLFLLLFFTLSFLILFLCFSQIIFHCVTLSLSFSLVLPGSLCTVSLFLYVIFFTALSDIHLHFRIFCLSIMDVFYCSFYSLSLSHSVSLSVFLFIYLYIYIYLYL